MRKETVTVKVEACCASCKKSTLHDLYDEKIFCELTQTQTTDESECAEWEYNFNLFDICGFSVEGVEAPSLFEQETVDDKNINLAKEMGYIK